MSGVGNSVNRGNPAQTLDNLLFAVRVLVGEEVAAGSFAPNIGHLRGKRSQRCNRLLH